MACPLLLRTINCGTDLATTFLDENLELVKLEFWFVYPKIVEGAHLRKIEQKWIKKCGRLVRGFILIFLISNELLHDMAVKNPLISNDRYLIDYCQQHFRRPLRTFMILYDQNLRRITIGLLHNHLSIAAGHGQLFTKDVDCYLDHVSHFLG